jgi:branched-chain amino acid transport system permease protein
VNPRKRALLVAAVALALLALPASGSSYWIYTLTIVGIYATALIGLNLLVGYAGQMSFATTTFMAAGGYAAAVLTTKLQWNPWVACATGVVLAGVLAYAIGFPLLRLRGHYLAMATFALAICTISLVSGAQAVTGGTSGLPGVPALTIGSVNFSSPVPAYYFALAVCALALVAASGLVDSRIGRAWRALAKREDVATSVGIDVRRAKVAAFVVSAVFAAISGAMYVEFTSFVSPDLYDSSMVVQIFIMLFIGGVGTTFGPLLGTTLVVVSPVLLGRFAADQSIVFEIALLIVLVVRPQGILGRASGARPLAAILPAFLQRRRRGGSAV